MELDTFLYQLHFETEKIFPPDWQVDWTDAPLPYKLYRNLPDVPLRLEVPFTLNKREKQKNPTLKDLGHFLWYVYGLSQFVQSASNEESTSHDGGYVQSLRRFVPSGGALYPNEVYVYIKLDDAPVGIYHYDAAHHRLDLLREGNYDSYLFRSFEDGNNMNESFCTVFISTIFWKNFYKYNHFSYRLQGLDTGVVIGQTLEVSKNMGFSPRVYYQFLDLPIHHLLGLSQQDESVYAVISLTNNPKNQTEKNKDRIEHMTSTHHWWREVPELKPISYSRSKKVFDYPMLRQLNEASMIQTTESFVKVKNKNREKHSFDTEMLFLPFTGPFSYDFSSVCRKRFSPDNDFILGKVSQTQLSTLFQETLSYSYENDLDDIVENAETRVSMCGCLYNVEGIPNGAYSYDKSIHALRKITYGDFRRDLQAGLTMPNVNLYQVPICLHIVGDKEHLIDQLGYRGYRIQQMEAGILLQRLLLVASALGLGGHPLLGFDAKQCDKLYRIDSKGKTSLIQIPVGPYRPRAWLKGSLI